MDESVAATPPVAAPATRRQVAIKAVFSGDYSGSRGALLVVLDPHQLKLDRVHVIVANEKTDDRFRVNGDWKALEDALVSAKLHGQAIVELSRDVQNYIRKAVQDDVMEPLAEALRLEQVPDVRRIMVDVVSKAIADANVLMQIGIEPVVIEEPVDQAATVAAEPAASSTASEPVAAAPAQLLRVRIDPILSPVSGIAAKNVTPGMSMIVEVKDAGAAKTALARALELRMPGSAGRGQFEAKVVEVKPADYDRVSITVTLGSDIIGTTNISGELRVKVSDASAKLASVRSDAGARGLPGGPLPPVPTNIFLWAALGILAIMAVLAYLVFGGII